jgi:hypothetical protein
LADKDEERFLDSIWTVAKVCRDTEQIGVLIDGVKKEVSDFSARVYENNKVSLIEVRTEHNDWYITY